MVWMVSSDLSLESVCQCVCHSSAQTLLVCVLELVVAVVTVEVVCVDVVTVEDISGAKRCQATDLYLQSFVLPIGPT